MLLCCFFQTAFNTVQYSLVQNADSTFFYVEKNPNTGAGEIYIRQSLKADVNRRTIYTVCIYLHFSICAC